MTTKRKRSRPRPVVLQVSASGTNPVALQAALRIARALERDFESIFVEDDDLFSLAAMPFAREISVSGRSRPLNQEQVARQMRAASSAAHREIERSAREADMPASFAVVRDEPEHAMREASSKASILALGEPVTQSGRREVDTLMSCLAGAMGCLLVGSGARRSKGRVVAVIDQPERLNDILKATARFAGSAAREIGFITLGQGMSARRQIEAGIRKLLPADLDVGVESLSSEDPGFVAAAVQRLGGGLLIARFGGPLIPRNEVIARLTAQLDCPLLLLRTGAENGDD